MTYNPVSTYRIQFHKDFTLAQFQDIIPYLVKLGVQTVYASPVFAAVPGSTHGYDGIDPQRINPEIGTEQSLSAIAKMLSESGIGWLQDIVPNHMAFHPDNTWLMDVLEHGKASRFFDFFDIDCQECDQLMVPFLGTILEVAIDRNELQIARKGNKNYLQYFDSYYPLNKDGSDTVIANEAKGKTLDDLNRDHAFIRRLADDQYYRLCHWQETDDHINYRRFFIVNGLICLDVQHDETFLQVHTLVKRLIDNGTIQGLRIDHIDGLHDPTNYLEQLRTLVGENTYTIVEKILASEESLPANWQVQGTTGYDFLSLANNLFTNHHAERAFTRFYQRLVNDDTPIAHQIQNKKAQILYEHMQGELEHLYLLFLSLDLGGQSVPSDQLKSAIGELLIQFPVYRFYGNNLPLPKDEARALKAVLAKIMADKPRLQGAVVVLQKALLADPLAGHVAHNQNALTFYQRCMQFTGPLMAKGVEDTLMYTYHRFIGHNEVGDSPSAFGISKADFHRAMLERQAKWPLALNGTATHDTKRGEDVRARLNVLTDMHEDWFKAVRTWRKLNDAHRQNGMPDSNDEYFIYQTLVGAYPIREADAQDFPRRMREYLIKALREAKTNSNWSSPNETYEAATIQFLNELLDPSKPFWPHFTSFVNKVVDFGIINSLSQLVLKFTCPGVPDTYQGTELWDFSLVDPDNRRAVDYGHRLALLEELEKSRGNNLHHSLWEDRYNGQIKLWLTQCLMQLRVTHKELFAEGQYLPLKLEGRYKDHVFAFARRYQDHWLVVAVPLHLAKICSRQNCDPLNIDWKDTVIKLQPDAPTAWKSLLDTTTGNQKQFIPVQEVFQNIPIGMLQLAHPVTKRSAGILMSVSSLPSRFGIGDFGPEARKFVRFLSRSHQSYWQLLPINPVSEDRGCSPYSSVSSMAGNVLFVSPELLCRDGLLDNECLSKHELPSKQVVDFPLAIANKMALVDAAYQEYQRGHFPKLARGFFNFKEEQKGWLHDFALFTVLKDCYNGQPWNEWPNAFRQRDTSALQALEAEHWAALEQIKWQQFIFYHQWVELRTYCRQMGVKLFGDLPFYPSYDSADVWTYPQLFSVSPDGELTGIAGVPPDYFSETGQLWGMPTFNWAAMKQQNYSWWVERIRKNLDLFDVLRIDHFRALASYWEVPAGAETAAGGKWLPGPGHDFFHAIKSALGELPFIAEDLGYEMEAVYELRDRAHLPGMKVLQFAFQENMPQSVDAPHNFSENCVVYTGTHDNNTTLGWYKQEMKPADKRRLEGYVGHLVTDGNVIAVMMRMAYSSVAQMAILPMQDVLQLDERSRMNIPSSANGNWAWRMKAGALTNATEKWLRILARRYNRV